jgi:SAM-dependent methyltransferase
MRTARRHAGRAKRKLENYLNMLAAKNALLDSHELSEAEKRVLKITSLSLAPNDTMHVKGESRHYLGVGLSAMRCINRILQHTRTDVGNILDLPCGHGRVLRFLRSTFANAQITACEIDPDGVRFCEQAFTASGIISTHELATLTFPNRFDLIWCGSLVTHLDRKHASDLLHCFYRHLAPNGVCLFTSHGQTSREWLESGEEYYGLSSDIQRKLLTELAKTGYGYADYSVPGYGISVVSFECMTKIASDVGDWCLVAFMQRGWDDHQDVYGYIKSVTGAPEPLIINAARTKPDMRSPLF